MTLSNQQPLRNDPKDTENHIPQSIPISWSPVKSQRDVARHMNIRNMVQRVLQTCRSSRQDQPAGQQEVEVDQEQEREQEQQEEQTLAPHILHEIEGVIMPTEEDVDKTYTPNCPFVLWQGGLDKKRKLNNIMDLDVIMDMMVQTAPDISENIKRPAIRKAFNFFLNKVKKDLKETMTHADKRSHLATEHARHRRLIKASRRDLKALQDDKYRLRSKLQRLQRKHNKIQQGVSSEHQSFY